jgi:hypothetical protein
MSANDPNRTSAGVTILVLGVLRFAVSGVLGNGQKPMRRREFIGLLGAAMFISPRDGIAQSSAKTYRLASLTGNVPLSVNTPNATTLLNALGQRGYILGQNIAYDARGASGEIAKNSAADGGFQGERRRRARRCGLSGSAFRQDCPSGHEQPDRKVRFASKSRHDSDVAPCPLCAKSGHQSDVAECALRARWGKAFRRNLQGNSETIFRYSASDHTRAVRVRTFP